MVSFGDDDEERLVVQRLGDDTRFLEGFCDYDGIDVAALERFGQDVRVVLFKHQGHFRRGFAQGNDELGQKVGGDGKNQTEFECAFQFVLLFAGKVLDHLGFFQHAAGLGNDALARFSGDDVVAAAVKQGHRQLFFQLFDGDGKGGLADKAAARGTSEMTLLRDGYDVTQFGQGHVLSLFLFRFLFRQGDVQFENVHTVLFFLGNADVVQRNVDVFGQYFQQFFTQGRQIVGCLTFLGALLCNDDLQAVACNSGGLRLSAEQHIH